MVLRREAIQERLKELDQILGELGKYRDIAWEKFQAWPSRLRWRGRGSWAPKRN